MSASVWVHASEVLTGEGIRRKDGRRVLEEDLGRIEDGAVVTQGSRIAWVGRTAELPKKYLRLKRKNLKLSQAILPGLVDCHTHLVFAGNRADEFAARCGGATYEEIAAKGGGIVSTMRATREAPESELLATALERAREAYGFGVRVMEVKSGYGLSAESELKLLRVAKKLQKTMPEMRFVPTFLGAHAFPPDRSRETYLTEILEKMLPAVAKANLAEACDVFIDAGYFTIEEGRKILIEAAKLGLKTKVHADELGDTGATGLAVELGALSADHLLKISDANIERIARSQTVAVLLPGTAFYLKAPHAPARRLLDAGACVALSTDFNPGTCVTLSLPVILTIAALYLGMTRAELFAAITYNAAKALGLENRFGTLEKGMDARFTILPFARFEEAYYRFAWSSRA